MICKYGTIAKAYYEHLLTLDEELIPNLGEHELTLRRWMFDKDFPQTNRVITEVLPMIDMLMRSSGDCVLPLQK